MCWQNSTQEMPGIKADSNKSLLIYAIIIILLWILRQSWRLFSFQMILLNVNRVHVRSIFYLSWKVSTLICDYAQ